MGRELQKKKNRSSLHKVRQKPKSKKVNIHSNHIIAAQWNQAETLIQNYRRLGLTARLNAATGGVEKRIGDPWSVHNAADPLAIVSAKPSTMKPGEVRVERDSRGAIVRLIQGPGGSRADNPLNDPLNDLESGENAVEVTDIGSGQTPLPGGVVRELEEMAQRTTGPASRKQSKAEEAWIEGLVNKYGDDYRSMFWDRKLNPMQQSEGDIRRRISKWRERRKRVEEV